MERFTALCLPDRGPGYTRSALRTDVLYNSFRFRDVRVTVSKKLLAATLVNDSFVSGMVSAGIIDGAAQTVYDRAVLEGLSHMDQLDHLSAEDLYRHIHSIRKAVLGTEAVDAYTLLQARQGLDFTPNGIDQSQRKQRLVAESQNVLFLLTDARFYKLMLSDLEAVRKAGKGTWVLDSGFVPMDGIPALDTLPESSCLLVYGEEGLTACRGLTLDAVVHAIPTGFAAQAVTGLWNKEGCVVYIPKGFDITPHVPLTSKTRLTYRHLAQLESDAYSQDVATLYARHPRLFVNIYENAPTSLPVAPANAASLQDFDRRLDGELEAFLGSFDNAQYISTYFDENLICRPICYDATQTQGGILVQAARIKRSAGAKVLQCEKGVTPRQMFRDLALPGTALVSNFLFFMTPKLGVLYNGLRADRPYEQADAASGHLDYMLAYREGRRIETFPLFGKTCIAMTEEGKFLFSNFFMGGGSVDISGISYRWEKEDVNAENTIRLYTPYHSSADKDADRDTYCKFVGQGRVNVILLREKVTCVRKGDVMLPSVGVVLSLTEEAAAPLLQKLQPLEDGYYDVSGLELTVQLDPPADVEASQWESVRWAFGGGLTLIKDGVGLCDGDHMSQWFEREGWTSPLSRQTQESNLHSLVKHPRTAIGCAENGDLVVLVYSGRTWRSTGADYREMIAIARQLFPDVRTLMNGDGGGSAMLGLVHEGEFLELSYPSTSAYSCAGQVRPINTVFYIPAGERKEI